jgi:hypothetical protein
MFNWTIWSYFLKKWRKKPQNCRKTTICKKRHKISLALLNFCYLKPINPCTCFRCDALLYVNLSYSDSIVPPPGDEAGPLIYLFTFDSTHSTRGQCMHAIVHYHCYLGYIVIVMLNAVNLLRVFVYNIPLGVSKKCAPFQIQISHN